MFINLVLLMVIAIVGNSKWGADDELGGANYVSVRGLSFFAKLIKKVSLILWV